MKIKKTLLALVCILSSLVVNAQTGSFQASGVVIDDQNSPLPGVTVILKGTTTGTTTDNNGNFVISAPNENTTLVFSYIGFTSKEVQASRNVMRIILSENVQDLGEIVVIGYGSIRKSDLTGSVSNISSAEIMQKPSSNPMSALQGKVVGMTVNNNTGAPGGKYRTSIRGFNSINASNSPLFVIDGLIGADFSMYNASDIESVDVLKDASATAIYGARGANGVIIVTTKKGKSGAAQVSYNGSVGIGYLSKDRKIDVLNSAEYMAMEKQAWEYVPGRSMPDYAKSEPDLFNPDGSPKYDTDWQDEATRNAVSTSHSLSIVGGSEKSSSVLSLGYDNNQGIMLTTYYKKYTARMLNMYQVNNWLKTDMSLSVSHTEKNDPTEGPGELNASRMMLEALPIIPLYKADGSWGSNAQHAGTEQGENPVNLLKNMIYKNMMTRAIGDFNITLTLAKGLELKSSFAGQLTWNKYDNYRGRELNAIAKDQSGIAYSEASRTIYLQNENYLAYNNIINGIHSLNVVAGASWNKNDFEFIKGEAWNYSDDFYLYHNLGAGSNPRPGYSTWDEWRMNSYFGRINYALDNKYLFTLTTRIDGSSRFGDNNKYATFPSGAVAWRINEEDFMKSLTSLSLLKLRASYGATGNDAIPNFQSISSTGSYMAIFDGYRYNGIGRGRIPNPDLKWERTNQVDAGIDLGLFKNRLNFTFDYYYKKTVGLLMAAPLASSSGYTDVMKNIGNMENKGIELTINAIPVVTKDFSWSVDLLFSANKNKILKLGEENEDIYLGPYFLDATNILRVGEAVNTFYGYERIGTWGTAEEAEAAKYGRKPGDLKFRDLNNDGRIDSDDRSIIGNGLPKFEGNFSSTFRYKNIDLSFDIAFKSGNDIMRLDYATMEDRQLLSNSFTSVLNAWRPDNQNSNIARLRIDTRDGSELKLSNHYIEDGSFIRGSNIVLGYSFDGAWMQKIKFQKMRVYVNAQNFFLITKYKGYDPETTNYGDTFAQGVEFMNYPKPRIMNIGVNLIF